MHFGSARIRGIECAIICMILRLVMYSYVLVCQGIAIHQSVSAHDRLRMNEVSLCGSHHQAMYLSECICTCMNELSPCGSHHQAMCGQLYMRVMSLILVLRHRMVVTERGVRTRLASSSGVWAQHESHQSVHMYFLHECILIGTH